MLVHNSIIFSDASDVRGYAAVSYLRIIDVQGKVHCVFVMGKSKMCSLKGMVHTKRDYARRRKNPQRTGRVRHCTHPFILSKDHYVSTLIVRHYHKLLSHAGQEHVLYAIRQRYWIVNARSIVRRLLRECVTCRNRNAPVVTQMMADLPKERLTPYQPPFTYTGIDFFGPFHIKRGRGTEKVYAAVRYT
ncbi:hypothetical protein QZH41_013561 [Actinostola sp. cb2023]|nr:hypothetical protein QZH41_013561 [Actinostola sp. cb2023]